MHEREGSSGVNLLKEQLQSGNRDVPAWEKPERGQKE